MANRNAVCEDFGIVSPSLLHLYLVPSGPDYPCDPADSLSDPHEARFEWASLEMLFTLGELDVHLGLSFPLEKP